MNTAAKPSIETASHWYSKDGKPAYEVPYADPKKGMRPTTLRDAKKLGLLPSATTLLKILDKPALTAWKVEQAVLTVLTSPRLASEEIDAFIKRVLHTDKEQEEEASKARELGSQIHDAIEKALSGEEFGPALAAYVAPVIAAVNGLGKVTATEKIIVGEGYAGRLDAIVETDSTITVLDFKTTKNLPRESYPEAKLQLSAYAKALGNTGKKTIQTANIYISTTEQGKIAVFGHADCMETFEKGFKPLQKLWCWMNDYDAPLSEPEENYDLPTP
jgi:ATP-dependent exoDNAse (exonuclease V) beta subunit